MNFDPKVTEAALFNYIAARTHGGNIPFSSSIPVLNGFLRQFPGSKYAPGVREYLATAYFNEKNYAGALESVNKIPNPSKAVLTAKQKILYELGMEAMANNRPADARDYLSEAVSLRCEPSLTTRPTYGLATPITPSGNMPVLKRPTRRIFVPTDVEKTAPWQNIILPTPN